MLKKDKLVEEFWKWYKTVRTVNWKELGEDYLFGPKDFLTVGVLLKAVGFDKIMAYLVLKKQALRLPKNLVGASREEICAHSYVQPLPDGEMKDQTEAKSISRQNRRKSKEI